MNETWQSLSDENARLTRVQQLSKFAFLPAAVPRIERQSQSGSVNHPLYFSTLEELAKLGFGIRGHFVGGLGQPVFDQTFFTSAPLGLDAILFGAADDQPLRVEIFAHHKDGTYSCGINLPPTDDISVPSQVFRRIPIDDYSLSGVVRALRGSLRADNFQPVTRENCYARFHKIWEDNGKDRKWRCEQEIANGKIVLPNGKTPRFDRIGVYLRPCDDSWNLTTDSQKMTKFGLKALAKTNSITSPSASNLDHGVMLAAELCCIRHLEYCGSPKTLDFLKLGERLGTRFFDAFAEDSDFAKLDHVWGLPTLIYTVHYLALKGNWQGIEDIGSGIRAAYALPSNREPGRMPPQQLARTWRIIVSEFKNLDAKTPKRRKSVREKVMESNCDWAKSILVVWDSIIDKDQQAFSTAFLKCLTIAVAECQEHHQLMPIIRYRRNIFFWSCWQESVLLLFAKRRGLVFVDESGLTDWLLTHESLGIKD